MQCRSPNTCPYSPFPFPFHLLNSTKFHNRNHKTRIPIIKLPDPNRNRRISDGPEPRILAIVILIPLVLHRECRIAGLGHLVRRDQGIFTFSVAALDIGSLAEGGEGRLADGAGGAGGSGIGDVEAVGTAGGGAAGVVLCDKELGGGVLAGGELGGGMGEGGWEKEAEEGEGEG
jgi:hypothetical protein